MAMNILVIAPVEIGEHAGIVAKIKELVPEYIGSNNINKNHLTA